ncbi:GIY-YIG nuclease family protein [Streptomyces sp. NPDC001858]
MTAELVYVLGTPGSNTVKIGRTTNLTKRVADIQRMSPVPLAVLWSHPGGSELEAKLHRHFADRRCHGEWFAFDSDPIPLVQQAVAEALRPKPPRLSLDSPRAQELLRLVDEAAAEHRMRRAQLEQTIAEARRAGCSLTLISEHVPFSREWIRRTADKVDREALA